MVVKKKLMTAEELEQLDKSDPETRMDMRYELVRGKLIKMPPAGPEHSGTQASATAVVGSFVRAHDLGRVYAGDPGFVLERGPDTVRAPDICFIAKERLHLVESRQAPFFGMMVPDLAIEVESEGRTRRQRAERVRDFLERGVQIYIYLRHSDRTATVHEPGREPRLLGPDAVLTSDPVLPGFRCRVADLF